MTLTKKDITEEEEIEENIQKYTNEIKLLYKQATRKSDLDFILKRFSIKCIKNKKKSSPMLLKMNVKKKIIQMAINEPLDTFDYDYYAAAIDVLMLGSSSKTTNP